MITIATLLIAVKHSPQNTGICNQPNVRSLRPESYELLKKTMTEWPKFSGDSMYPIPAPSPDVTAYAAYHECENMWDEKTEYGALRIELLDWLIANPVLNEIGRTP